MEKRKRVGPYGEEDGSILRNLNKMSPEARRLFWKALRKSREDEAALQRWADDGFVSPEPLDGVVGDDSRTPVR